MSNMLKGKLAVKGERGYSAYEVAVQNGFSGTEEEWLDSLITRVQIDTSVNKDSTDNNAPSSKLFYNTIKKIESSLISKVILTAGTTVTNEYEITFPINYVVGNSSLEIFWNGVRLTKANDTEDGHYLEVGDDGTISNKIKIYRTNVDGDYILTEDAIITAVSRYISQ